MEAFCTTLVSIFLALLSWPDCLQEVIEVFREEGWNQNEVKLPPELELTSPAAGGLSWTFLYDISGSSVKQNLRDLTHTLMGNYYVRTTVHVADGKKEKG